MQNLALIVLIISCAQEASVLSCGRPSLAMSAPDVGLGFCHKVHSMQLAAAAIAYLAKPVLSLAVMSPACLCFPLLSCLLLVFLPGSALARARAQVQATR